MKQNKSAGSTRRSMLATTAALVGGSVFTPAGWAGPVRSGAVGSTATYRTLAGMRRHL